MDELDKGEKGIGDGSVSYGLNDRKFILFIIMNNIFLAEDMALVNWNGTILGPYGVNKINLKYKKYLINRQLLMEELFHLKFHVEMITHKNHL